MTRVLLDIKTPGCQLLNGVEALQVVRARHFNTTDPVLIPRMLTFGHRKLKVILLELRGRMSFYVSWQVRWQLKVLATLSLIRNLLML